MKATILVIEDNEKNAYLVTFILEKCGYQVIQARDGEAGIALARQIKPDLILLDIQLPVMDGYAVARELTRNGELRGIPIVAVTSYAMLGDRERILAAGCVGYIEKPINPPTFVAEIEQYLPADKKGNTLRRSPMSTLLIVDDNQQNLYMLQVLLSANGFQVERASNGAEALERARRAPPDMIISDILMPVMDGFALCRAWKEDERLKNIPFVFYTATYTDPKDEDFALSLGADRFIIKPVEPDKFLALLWETMKNYEAGKPVAPRQPVEEAEYYKEYNAALIRKLEDKMLQLEEANRILERDIAERKRAEDEKAALFEIAKDIAGVVELSDLLKRVNQRTAAALPCDYVVTYYFDATRGAYRALAWYGVPLRLEPDMIALEFTSGQPLVEAALGMKNVAHQRHHRPGLGAAGDLTHFGVSPR